MPSYSVQMDGVRDYTLTLTITPGTQEISNNRTLVSWSLVASGTWGSYVNYATSYSVNIGGQVYSGSIPSANPNPSATIVSGSTWIYHNADGTKSFNSSGYWNSNHSNIGKGTVSVSNFSLTTIPRASYARWTDQVSTKYAGGTYALNTQRASTSFTHTMTYTFGTKSGTIGTGITNSIDWTIPLDLLTEFPNSATGNGVITTKTYNGATLVGTTTSGFGATVPTTAVPSWTSVAATEAVSAVATKVGAFVQGLSKISHSIVGAAGIQGSTITQRRFQIENQTVDGATGTTPGVITGSGTVPATFTVTDSRGQKKTQVNNLTVLPYAAPLVTAFTAVRALSDGTVSPDNGTYLKVTLTAVSSSLINGTQKNTIGIRVYSKLRSASTWTLRQTLNPSGIVYNSSFVVTGPFVVDQAHDIRIEVFDQFSVAAAQTTIAVASIFMHWGNGLGVAKYHERGALDVGGDIYQKDQKVFSLQQTLYLTTSGTFTKATYPWLAAIRVRAVGGGGSGAGAASAVGSMNSYGTGGGSGAYAESLITNIAALAPSVTVTVGAGGSATAAGAIDGSNGGATSFGSDVIAGGGGGGYTKPNSALGGYVQGGTPGVPTAGDVQQGGSPGGQGMGRDTLCQAGNGGSSIFGGGGFGAATGAGSGSNTGYPGTAWGAGGSGAAVNSGGAARASGAGAAGVVIVELYA